jgi:transposase
MARRFLERFRGAELEVALEATTGWRFVVEELRAIGAGGAPRRAGGDRRAARQQEARQVRPRGRWAHEQVTVAIAMIDALDVQLAALDRELRAYARRQVGCRALMAHYGIGALTAVTILAELGDCRRFSSSRHAVSYSGLDITVHQSDQRRAPGPSLAPGATGAALGAVRGRPGRAPPGLPRPRLLHSGRRAPRRQPRLPNNDNPRIARLPRGPCTDKEHAHA